MPQPIQYDASHLDLSPRFFQSKTVAASPALAAETIICSVTLTGDIATPLGVFLYGWCAFTMGTSGVSSVLRLRATNVSGTIIAASGATTGVAAALYQPSILGVDTAPVLPGQVYVLTMQNASASAASTVSAAQLVAVAV